MDVWTSKNRILHPNQKKNIENIINRMAALFSAGPVYYFVFNMESFTLDYVSESTRDVLGVEAKEFSVEKVFSLLHPEDIEKMHEKEAVSLNFLLNKVPPEDIPLYKVSYLMRLRHADGTYKTILHQSTAINVSLGGKVQQTMCVHTDVTHLNIPYNHKMSFISTQRPSYYSIETSDPDKFLISSYKERFTNREIDIIEFLSKGFSYNEIAEKLYVSPHTINTHKRNILKKSDCKNTAELIAKCVKEGVI